jgi:hypothetical protein
MSGSQRLLTFAKFAAVFAAPFAIAVGSWEIAERFVPGRFATWYWHLFSAVAFLGSGATAIFMLFRTRMGRVNRVILYVICSLVSLFFAAIFSSQSRCGDEATFIGKRQQEKVVSCQ